MLNRNSYENSIGDGFPVLQAIIENVEFAFVPLKKTELFGDIQGPLARLTLVQTFGYSKILCNKILEAKYRFPLPGDAAVTDVRITFGDNEIVAELKERQQAQADYEKAKADGKQAALTSREAPDIFTLSLAGIKPDEEVKVETTYVQLAKPEFENWGIRVPLTTVPRFCSDAAKMAPNAEGSQNPLALMRDPQHRFALALNIIDGEDICSNTHQIKNDNGLLTLAEGEVIPNKDFVLSWKAKRQKKSAGLQVFTHNESEWTYFMALATPPAEKQKNTSSREIVLLLDHSGSMGGSKIEAGYYTARQFLSRMNERDTFSFGLFDDYTRWMNNEPLPATKENIDRVDNFINAERYKMGGTQLVPALTQALNIHKDNEGRSRHLLIITDAQIYERDECVNLANKEFKSDNHRRISVICIDASPNSHLVYELAEAGGGEAKFLSSDPKEGDVASTLDNLLTQWEDPIAVDMRLMIYGAETVEVIGKTTRTTKDGTSIDLGDLPSGRSVWVCGRVAKSKYLPQFQLSSKDGELAHIRRDVIPTEYSFAPAIKSLFGARRIAVLEHILQSPDQEKAFKELGYDIKEFKELRDILVKESLNFGIASTETSFVAVNKNGDAKVEGEVSVPNAVAEGCNLGLTRGIAPAANMASRSLMFASAGYSRGPQNMLRSCSLQSLSGAGGQSAGNSAMGYQNLSTNYMADPNTQITFHHAIDVSAAGAANPNMPIGAAGSKGHPGFIGHAGTLAGAGGQSMLTPGEFVVSKPKVATYEGIPINDQVIYESSTIGSTLEILFPDGVTEDLSNAFILIYVGDMGIPKARIRLKDFINYSKRPLSIGLGSIDTVKIVMAGTIQTRFSLFLS